MPRTIRILARWGTPFKIQAKPTPTVPPPPNFYLGPSSLTLHHVLHERRAFFENQDLLTDFDKWQPCAVSSGTSWAAIGQKLSFERFRQTTALSRRNQARGKSSAFLGVNWVSDSSTSCPLRFSLFRERQRTFDGIFACQHFFGHVIWCNHRVPHRWNVSALEHDLFRCLHC